LGRREAQAGTLESAEQHPTLDDDGAGGDQLRSELLGDVVMVALESSARDPVRRREGVEFVVGDIAHEVAPPPAPVVPTRFVDQDRHGIVEFGIVEFGIVEFGIVEFGIVRPGRPGRLEPGTLGVAMANDVELRVAWHRHVGRGRPAEAWFDSVTARYRAVDRRYHDIRHLRWVVRHVGALLERVDVDDPDAVVAAAFFHDAVHAVDRTDDPTDDPSGDDEERSAALAHRALHELGWTVDRCDLVARMILATTHRADGTGTSTSDGTGTAVLLAADLAVLATEPAAYGDYTRAVRAEYGHLDDEQWRQGRRAVIESFLGRTAIFPIDLGLHEWERRARANLTAESAALR
jgi:predicted metal-dependent HD superfamily phosphohydrolase